MRIAWSVLTAALWCSPAFAGPPFVTDDPEPTDYGHFEIYLLSEGTFARDESEGTLPGLEVNYGAFSDIQVSGAISEAFENENGTTRWQAGEAEFGVKYRFMNESDTSWQPQLAFYPSVTVALDGESPSILLPIWAQKSWSDWTVYGGGGYQINTARENRNNWIVGVALLRQVTSNLQLGGELYHQTADETDEPGTSAFNLGAILDFDETHHIVMSAGRALDGSNANHFSYYIALEWSP